jgi:ethanolamine permease
MVLPSPGRLAARHTLRSPASVVAGRPSTSSVVLGRPSTANVASAVGGSPSRQSSAVASRGTAVAGSPAFRPGKWDIWFLGIAIGFGGQYFSWNAGLKAGLYSFLVAYFVVGFAYITLCCCTSEITGALPFAGGAYGLSRCTLGFYPGFIIGCIEALEYITYVSTAVLSLTNMLVEIGPWLSGTEPVLALIFYLSALGFHCRGGKLFWRWNLFIGVLSLFFVLLYCVGSFRDVDFANNADTDPQLRYIDGLRGFVTQMPLACWFFVGVEALNLASDDVASPRTVIPFAQLSCITVLFCVGIVVLFVTVSLPPPGINQVSKMLAPFNNGFQLLFHVEADIATLFSIPAMYATTFCFMWGYGKLISAMATSKLLPPKLALEHPKYHTPYNAVIFGSMLSYLICLLVYFVPAVDKYMYNICMAAAFLGYISQCVGYIALRVNYSNIRSSSFRSPFGVPGAVYSLTVWVLGFVSVCGFQQHSEVEVGIFVVVIACLSVFYFSYAQGRQTFSQQETKIFLVAHVMKLGKKAKRKKLHPKSSMNSVITRPSLYPQALYLQQRAALGARLSSRWRLKYNSRAPTALAPLSLGSLAHGSGHALVFPVDRSVETLRRHSLAIARDDENFRLPVADPVRAETPFYRHYCHEVPADPFHPWPEDQCSCCYAEYPQRLRLELDTALELELCEDEVELQREEEREREATKRRRRHLKELEQEEMDEEALDATSHSVARSNHSEGDEGEDWQALD